MNRLGFVATAVVVCALSGCALGMAEPAAAQAGNPAVAANAGLATNLTGGAVVPGPADPDGSGMARITFVAGEQNVCYELAVRNIQTATMAHIHPGTATEVGGPPLVVLGTPTTGESRGCVTAPQRLVDAIRANPSNFFVTVHNAEFPGGAVRGQFGG